MYYKITNQESQLYKRLHKLRATEIAMGTENQRTLEKEIPFKWTSFLGQHGQQNFWRTTQYSGFKFIEPEKVCLKTWNKHPRHEGYFIPNRRTKAGRRISDLLLNGLKGSNYLKALSILDLDLDLGDSGRFSFPYIEVVGEIIVLYLKHEDLSQEDLTEITRKEFNEILSAPLKTHSTTQ